MRQEFEDNMLDVADTIAKRSHDTETQVGCVIVDEHKKIVSTGFNGFPPGMPDDVLPNTRPDKYAWIVHSELNAIISARQDLRGTTLFCSLSPCRECAKAIITAGIARVVYRRPYGTVEDQAHVEGLLTMADVDLTERGE